MIDEVHQSKEVGPCERPVGLVCESPECGPHEQIVRCGTRVASKCSSCSQLYQQDARAIIYDGLDPAKPSLLITLTAPSFGKVHNVPKAGKDDEEVVAKKRCSCGYFHTSSSELAGVAVEPEHYDYSGAVLWNFHAGRLFDRFKTELNRLYQKAVALTLREWEVGFVEVPKIEMLKVVEFQMRGLVHFHVLVRGAYARQLVLEAARKASTSYKERVVDKDTGKIVEVERVVKFGKQVDVQLIPAGSGLADKSRARTGGYVAKLVTYVAKDLTSGRRDVRSHNHFKQLEKAAERLYHSRKVRECVMFKMEHELFTDEVTGEIFEVCDHQIVTKECSRARGGKQCRSALHNQFGWRGHVLSKTRKWAEKSFTSEREARKHFSMKLHGVEESISVHDWKYDPEVAEIHKLAATSKRVAALGPDALKAWLKLRGFHTKEEEN